MDKKIWLIVLVLVTVVLIYAGWLYYQKSSIVTPPESVNAVTFNCADGKTIGATFYPDQDNKVDLILSDGRSLSVPHAISASGARYANADESFVFWNKGDTAFIEENQEITFADCNLIAPEEDE